MYERRLRFDNHVALVAGVGGGGIGTETAVALAELGATVVGVDVSEDRVAEVADRMPPDARFLGVAADARDTSEVDRLVARAVAEHGQLDHLVNVVGGTQPGTWRRLEDLPDEVFEAVVALNLRTTIVVSRAFVRQLFRSEASGSIVNVASVSGHASAPYHATYGATKAGIMALTRSMAVEWGSRSLRVNCVAPGRVSTPRTRSMGRIGDTGSDWNPLGRDAEATEVAAAIAFLLSDLASGITGQTLSVDAGVTARSPLGGLDQCASRLPAEENDH